jgi:hypothetical protein
MKKIVWLSLILLIQYPLYSQVESPPTLALGVAGVVGEKGSIDVDLVAQIISEKQAELKKEFIKKSIFKDLDNNSYVLWEYMYTSMNVLLESGSKEAIKKNLLKNSANLALIYGFSELYLQIARRMCQPQLHGLLLKFDSKKYGDEFKCPGANDENLKIKLVDLKKYKLAVNDDSISFSAFFIDMAFEVLRNNKEVTETLGFLTNPFPLDKDFYIERSAYFKVQGKLGTEVEDFRKRLTEEVDILLSNYILIRKLYQSDKNLDSLIGDYEKEIKAIVVRTNKNLSPRDSIDRNNSTVLVPNLFNALVEKTKPIYEDLQRISATPQLDASRNTDRSANTAVANDQNNQNLSGDIAKVMAAFSRFVGKDTTFDQNDLYYIESSTKPLLLRLVTERNLDSKYLYIADEFDQLITYKLLKNLKDRLEGSRFKDLSKAKLSTLSDLLELITRLDELDKVETYEYVIKTIQDISEIFPERKLGMYVKTLVDNLERYTIINQEDKKVEIAVEDIITHIYDKYANRESKIFNLYFSIGVNQSITSNFTYQSLLPDSAGFDVDTLKSVAFVSEKIGFKIKIIDFKWRRSFSVGETYETRLFRQARTVRKFESSKPLVSDIYFVGYASGLLYKVANLTTKEEFNDPIAGIGVGVSFFNSLDLNLGYNWPLRSDNDFFESFEKNGLLTIGFDIKITEYLTALGKKRQKND